MGPSCPLTGPTGRLPVTQSPSPAPLLRHCGRVGGVRIARASVSALGSLAVAPPHPHTPASGPPPHTGARSRLPPAPRTACPHLRPRAGGSVDRRHRRHGCCTRLWSARGQRCGTGASTATDSAAPVGATTAAAHLAGLHAQRPWTGTCPPPSTAGDQWPSPPRRIPGHPFVILASTRATAAGVRTPRDGLCAAPPLAANAP